eukprot:TRINITY_DN16405_c0_g1_i1.p1 TRINITY_DN16405_c0_g1~~TRINITY_DN16405_c0_g1_i1.p1  ORF type:complete len:324 (+),score=110.63 TRINITY_DN16405_c0_g1_i1:46-972(+)
MSTEKKTDIFRDTAVRYLGYANELGESFIKQFPKLYKPSYVVSSGYVLCDTVSKSLAKYKKTKSLNETAKTGLDVLLWQGFASVIIPGFAIHQVVKFSQRFLAQKRIPGAVHIATALGLCSIPLIIKPIDHSVDFVMDKTIRKMLFKEKEGIVEHSPEIMEEVKEVTAEAIRTVMKEDSDEEKKNDEKLNVELKQEEGEEKEKLKLYTGGIDMVDNGSPEMLFKLKTKEEVIEERFTLEDQKEIQDAIDAALLAARKQSEKMEEEKKESVVENVESEEGTASTEVEIKEKISVDEIECVDEAAKTEEC